MKRIFALLLVLTLFCPSALAETIRQQVNTPESLQDTFTSNTGRMTIDIKADVIVPDISTLYEIDVTPRLFNDEELRLLEEEAKGMFANSCFARAGAVYEI